MATPVASAPVCHERTTVLQVSERRAVAADVLAFTLTDPSGGDLPSWSPGAHIDVMLPEVGVTRQYSLCGSPADRSRWRIAVLRDPNSSGGSRHLHQALDVGSLVEVRGPRNHFPLVESPRHLFIAGGIGITPILPMIETVAARGGDWELVYGGRTEASMAFLDDLAVHGDRVRVWPEQEKGLLPLRELLGTPRPGCVVYCCGPEPLLAAVESWCSSWPAGSLHVERFAARRTPPGGGLDDGTDQDAAFEVACRRSGRVLDVPAGRSILEVAEAAGVLTLSACREGVCGTCETPVLAGVPDHRDAVLSGEARASGSSLMICVSRSRSPRLVLDL